MSKKMSKTAKAKRRARRQFTNRHGIILIALLTVLILVVNLVVFSYSWFTPKTVEGKGLSIDETANIRSENCTFQTYQGEVVTTANQSQHHGYYLDQIDYNDTAIANNAVITIPAQTTQTIDGETVEVPGRVYFRTEIQNQDEQYPSCVSLYHYEMPADLYVAITYPTNTYFHNDEAYRDYFIIRNAYVKVRDMNDVDGPGMLPVEWFVENRSSTAKQIRVTLQTDGVAQAIPWLYLMYN